MSRVVVTGVTSSWWPATSDIQQDSVLGSVHFRIFINDVDKGNKRLFSQFANSTGLGKSVDLLEGRNGLQRDLERLDGWHEISCMRFKKAK